MTRDKPNRFKAHRRSKSSPPATDSSSSRSTRDVKPRSTFFSGQDIQPFPKNALLLYGFHAVREALRNKGRQHLILYATEPAARRLESEIAASGLVPQIVTTENLSRMLVAGAVHQGVALVTMGLSSPDLSAIPSGRGLVVVLDQITDPHNVGAILRLAAAFGVDAVITTERHAPEFYGITAKAASGGLEHVSVIRVVNLARALRNLGDLGYLRIGLDSEAATDLAAIELRHPLALVLGGEGKGLRRLSRENCDMLARLDLPGPIKSLNVSNACAVALTLLQRGLAASSTIRP